MDALSLSLYSTFPKSISRVHASLTPNRSLLNFSSAQIVNNSLSSSLSIDDKKESSSVRIVKNSLSSFSLEDDKKESFVPKRRPQRIKLLMSFLSVFLNKVENFVNNFVDPPTHPGINPEYVLSNNFAPVDELPPTQCEILEGTLPLCLNGAYIRNGPNPQHFPCGPYHLFDGDGMLHSLRIYKGKATLCSRYVQTYKYKIEHENGCSIVPNFFSGFSGIIAFVVRGALVVGRIAIGQFDPTNGFGLANTSLALIGGSLYALSEPDLPYAVKLTLDSDIVTLGRHDFDGKLSSGMTAHPKIDPDTREAFAFRYGILKPPFLTIFRITPDGKKQPDVPIFSMARPSLVHDFAITKRYAIFPETQIGINPFKMISGESLVGMDPTRVPRLGVIPRYAVDESDMIWFDTLGLNILHMINAWDEDDGETIVLLAPNVLSIQHFLEHMDLVHSSVEKVKINLKTGKVSRTTLSTKNLDFGVINPGYFCKKNKYLYAGIADPIPKISGVAKLDITKTDKDQRDCTVAIRMFGEGCFGGEPFFVAKEANNVEEVDEDDGYIVSYVHNEKLGETRFLVMDAKSPNLEIVAIVKLPQRVPYGFHGLFIKEADLNI